MTIAIQVTKSFLSAALSEQINVLTSKAKPKEEKSSFFASLYNTELSKKKRSILCALRNAINTIHDQSTDRMTATHLVHYIRHSKNIIELESQKFHQSPGSTEATLDLLARFVDRFYLKAKALNLIDIPDGTGAFAHFTKAVSMYYARRIMDDNHVSVFKGLIENPSITSINAFHQATDECVNRMYLFACRNLSGQKTYDESAYLEIKNQLGSFCLQSLIYEHEQLHREYVISSIILLPNYLGEYLIAAKKSISEDLTTHESPIFTDADIEDFGIDLGLDELPHENSEIEDERSGELNAL